MRKCLPDNTEGRLREHASNPPPKIQNKTGSLSVAFVPAGRMTFTVKQSSLTFSTDWKKGRFVTVPRTLARKSLELLSAKNCGHAFGIPAALKVPMLEVNLTGGLRRLLPVGGTAKGMPLKASVVSREAPTMLPDEVVTVGAARFSTTGAGGCGGAAATRPRRAKEVATRMVEIPFMLTVR